MIGVGSNDLEWPLKAGRKGSKFSGGFTHLRLNGLTTQLGMVTYVGQERVARVSATSRPKGAGPSAPPPPKMGDAAGGTHTVEKQ